MSTGLFIGVAGAILLAFPAFAGQVTNGNDGGEGSLREAVATAVAGETITFAQGVTTVTLTSGEIAVGANLTIQGSGTGGVIVQRDAGAPNFRIFNISGGAAVTLRGLTIRNGRGENFGGGIWNFNSSLTIEDCVIADNQTVHAGASLGGGVLSMGNNASATLTVTRSVVHDNVAEQGGGLQSVADGGTTSATVTDSTFYGNVGTSGSAISNATGNGGTANLIVTGSTITNNLVIVQPGAINAAVVTFSGSSSNLASSSFTNTTVSGNQGAGLIVYGQVGGAASQALHHVTVFNNTIGTTAAPSATSTTSYDRSVFAFTDDDVTQYFVAAGAGSTQTSGGYNVSKKDLPGAGATDLPNTDPLLDAAGPVDNGGSTDTVALQAGSPARDRIPTASCTQAFDQRGVVRPYPASGNCDSGAYEAAPIPQVIDFTGPGSGAVGASASLSATGGGSGNPVVFSVDGTSGAGVCSVSGVNGSTVNYTAAGSCVINANQAGNANYAAAAQVQRTITVGPGSQTIDVTTPAPGSAVYGSSFPVAATASSGLTVAITTTGECSIASGTVTMTSGTTACAVHFNQSGNANYNAAPEVVQTVAAQKASQTIGFAPLADRRLNQSPFTVSASASSGLPVTFTTTTPSRCAASGTNGATITLLATGTCTVKADQAGDANYGAAPSVSQSFTIGNKADQSITVVNAPPSSAIYGDSFFVSASATSGLPVSITATGGCSIANGTVTMTSGSTSCIVHYDQPGNGNYNAAPSVANTTAAQKRNQTITVNTPASATYNTTFAVSPSATSGLTVAITTSGGCSNSGTNVTMTSGTTACAVAFNQSGNANYNAATQVLRSVAATKASQSISFGPLSDKKLKQSPVVVSASASSGLQPTFISITPQVCTHGGTFGATITLVTTGTCTVQADQVGNADYSSANSAMRSFTVK